MYIFGSLIIETPKVITCDGDFGNREYEYLSKLCCNDSIIVYKNLYNPSLKHFIFTKDENTFFRSIDKDLKNGKNIAISSMSKNFAEQILEKYGKKYKVLCIHSDSLKEVKNVMKDLDKIKNYNIFVYSPTVTVGVDINYDHFYKIYGYICHNSVCGRDFMQMLGRVRKTESDVIHILVDKTVNTSVISNFYTINEVEYMVKHELYNNVTFLDKLRIWNYWEDINSTHYLFQVLLYYITKKGHTYSIIEGNNADCDSDDEKNDGSKFESSKDKTIRKISSAKNISNDEYNNLLTKQKDDDISKDEKYSIEKFKYAKRFGVLCEKVSESFLESRYGNLGILSNACLLLNIRSNYEDDDFRSDLKTKQKYWILKIIELFGYKIENTVINNVKVSKEDFNNVKANVIKTINNELRILFGIGKFSNEDFVKSFDTLRKSNISSPKTDTNKKFLGWFNGLLKSWGLKITSDKIMIKSKKQSIYTLNYVDFIDNYIQNVVKNTPKYI
jgi:hypothetical protein